MLDMRKLIIILSICIVFCSCGQWDDDSLSGPIHHPEGTEIAIQCRHEAILCYVVFNEHYPVEMCVGPSAIPSTYHVQTRALINGEWQWLKMSGDTVFTSYQDPFTVTMEAISMTKVLSWCDVDSPY